MTIYDSEVVCDQTTLPETISSPSASSSGPVKMDSVRRCDMSSPSSVALDRIDVSSSVGLPVSASPAV